jgi:hypothetical protein
MRNWLHVNPVVRRRKGSVDYHAGASMMPKDGVHNFRSEQSQDENRQAASRDDQELSTR